VDFRKFIRINRFHLHLDYFQVLEEDMPELVVKIVDIHDILENSGFEEYIIFTESQRITADPVIIVTEKEIPCSCFIINSEPPGAEDFQLFFDCPKVFARHGWLLISKTPSSVHVFPQRPEGDVIYILP